MRIWLLILTMLMPVTVSAHSTSTAYLHLEVGDNEIRGRCGVPLKDISTAINMDKNRDGKLDDNEINSSLDAVADYIIKRLQIKSGASACPLQTGQHTEARGFIITEFTSQCPVGDTGLDINYNLLFDIDQGHRGLLRLQYDKQVQTAIFSADNAEQNFKLGRVDHMSQLFGYIREGIWHIWIGYDHILFLISLLLPAVLIVSASGRQGRTSLRQTAMEVATIVTAFTLAHSLTLSAAVLEWITPPGQLVEAVIALSVILAALNNIYQWVTKRVWLIAFVFGLIHGFGFAGVLQDVGLADQSLLLSLFGFNIGVEAGQLAIILATVPVFYLLRNRAFYECHFVNTGSGIIAGIAILWLTERLFDIALISPALAMFMVAEKALYAGLLLVVVVIAFTLAEKFLSLQRPVIRSAPLSAAAVVVLSGMSLAYIGQNVPLTDEDQQAAIMRALGPAATPFSQSYKSHDSDENRLFKSQLLKMVQGLQSDNEAVILSQLQKGNSSGLRKLLDNRRDSLKKAGRTQEASQYLFQLGLLDCLEDLTRGAETIRLALTVNPGMTHGWEMLGDIHTELDKHDMAYVAYQQAIGSQTDNNKANTIALTRKAGNSALLAGQLDRAEKAFRDFMRLSQTSGKLEWLMDSFMLLGEAFHAQGKLTNARQMYLQALDIAQKRENKNTEARLLTYLGDIYAQRWDFAGAIDMYRQSMLRFEALRDYLAMLDQHVNLAKLAEMQRNWPVALQEYDQAIQLGLKTGQQQRLAAVYTYQAKVLQRQHRYGEAITAYKKAIDIDKQYNNRPGVAINYANIAIVYQLQKNWPEAEAKLKQALAINKQIKRKVGLASNLANLGNLYKETGQIKYALNHYEQSHTLFKEIGASQNELQISNWIEEIKKLSVE